jgi:hypothetical protein
LAAQAGGLAVNQGGSVADAERVDIVWQKSLASGDTSCVEVAFTDESVLVRNSQKPQGHQLAFSYSEWAAFLTGVRHGEFDPDRPN